MAEEMPSSSNPPQGEETGPGSEPTSPSLEDLQRQLAEMEATQSEMASRLQQQTELMDSQLDSRLAVIEEQFRHNFDDRLRSTAPPVQTSRSAGRDSSDVLVVNRVFREVSRCMGDEWRPVFDALMAPLARDVVDQATNSLQQHPPLIQVRVSRATSLRWRLCDCLAVILSFCPSRCK